MMAGDGHSTGHSAVPRPRPTGAPQVLAALLALLACPSAAMAVFILVAGQQVALPHLVFCLLQLVILVPLVRGGARWLRPTRLSRPRDATPPLLLLLAAVLVLGVTRLRAYWDGILGSALPRVRSGVRSGVPLEVDLLYLAATGLAMLSLLAAAGSIALLIWNAGPVRDLRGHGRDLAEETSRTVLHPSDGEAPAAAAGPPVATGADEPFWRRHLSPLSRVLLALAVVATPASILLFALARPAPALSDLLLLLAAFAPVPGVTWAVLASLWRRDEELGIVRAALLRTLVLPPLSVAGFLPAALLALLPAVSEGFDAQRLVAVVDDEIVPPGISPLAWVALSAVMAVAASILAGLAVIVVVVMLIVAFFMPQVLIRDNDMSTAPEHRRQNIAAVRALTLLIVLIFVFSLLITDADTHDARFWAAMAVLLAIVALTWYVWRTQRVDHARRRVQGTQARAPGPQPPARPDRMREEPGSGPSPS